MKENTYWVLGGHEYCTERAQTSTGHSTAPFVVICLFTHASSSNLHYTKVLVPDTDVLVCLLQFQDLLLRLSCLEVPKRPLLVPKTCRTAFQFASLIVVLSDLPSENFLSENPFSPPLSPIGIH